MTTNPARQGVLHTHANHYLFSDYYLNNRLAEQADWDAPEIATHFQRFIELWAAFHPQQDNESQTEADWIRPVLDALGHTYNVQVALQTPFGVRRPDYILYPDDLTRQAAKARTDPFDAESLRQALLLADAKAWDRPLDKASPTGGDRGISNNPSLQIYVYLQYSCH